MTEIEKESRTYKILHPLARILMFPICRVKAIGKENIPDGAAMYCANHSSYLDPFVICFALGRLRHIHIIAKIELFRIPVIRSILKAIGTIPVDRSTADIGTVKASLRYLRNGERVGIFPEGTRVSKENAVASKLGAVKLAVKTGVPIVPIYIPRRKSAFRTVHAVIGKPYYINTEGQHPSAEDYERYSSELMANIEQLKYAEA